MNIRTKILTGLVFLLATAVGVNLFYSYKIISADKENYIFEGALRKLDSVSEGLISSMNSILNKSNNFYLLSKSSPEDLSRLLNEEDFLLSVSFSENQEEKKNFFNKEMINDFSGGEVDQYKVWLDQVSFEDSSEEVEVNVLEYNDVSVLSLIVNNKGVQIHYVVNLQYFESLFLSDGGYETLLLINQKNIFKHKVASPKILSGVKGFDGSRGVIEVSDQSLEDEFLVSFSKFPKLSITIFSYASKNEAFSFLTNLIYNNVFFGAIVLGSSLIIGLYFSKRLTAPLLQLAHTADLVGKGDYTQRVEISTNDEIETLGDRFNEMIEKISQLLKDKEVIIDELKDAKLKLEEYSQNLELMVDERTKELREANDFIEAMINSIDQGIFVFDKDLNCMDIYTKSCDVLFEKSPPKNKFYDVLSLNESEKTTVERWADIIFADKIPFDSAKDLGPKKKVYGENPEDEDFKHVGLSYYPMRDSEEKIKNVVVIATDRTKEELAKLAFEKNNAYVKMILKLVKHKTSFFKFFDNCEEMFAQLSVNLKSDSPSYDKAMLIYHSMNGGFGSFSLLDLQQQARSCEQVIVDAKKAGTPPLEIQDKLIEDFDSMYEAYKSKKAELETTINIDRNKREIDISFIESFRNKLIEKGDSELIEAFTDTFERSPVGSFFGGYADLVDSLSNRLDKPMNPLQIPYEYTRIHWKKYDEFFDVLVHLFRNCLDHGIEPKQKRKDLSKPETGTILVEAEVMSAESEDKKLAVRISDDGGGIDPIKVRERLIDKMGATEEEVRAISDKEIIYKIFDQDFSTKDEVTDLSGRGVGMSSIKDVVERMGGKVEVVSMVNKGSQFTFYLPYF